MKTPTEAAPLRLLARFGRPHGGWLLRGLAGTLAWVGLRLAMPWPLRGLVESAFPAPGTAHHAPEWIGAADATVLWFCGAYLAIAAATAIAETQQRAAMTKFAALTVTDLRAAALRGIARSGAQEAPGDLMARLVGDT